MHKKSCGENEGGPKKSAKASSGRAATPQRHERSPTPEYESKTYDFDPNMKSTMVRAKGAPDIDGSSNTIFILDLMRQQVQYERAQRLRTCKSYQK